jgi:hypothetical protein
MGICVTGDAIIFDLTCPPLFSYQDATTICALLVSVRFDMVALFVAVIFRQDVLIWRHFISCRFVDNQLHNHPTDTPSTCSQCAKVTTNKPSQLPAREEHHPSLHGSKPLPYTPFRIFPHLTSQSRVESPDPRRTCHTPFCTSPPSQGVGRAGADPERRTASAPAAQWTAG